MNRREFSALAMALAVSAVHSAKASDPNTTAQQHSDMRGFENFLSQQKVTVGMVVYPGMFLMDLVGPLGVFDSLMNKEIHFIAKDLQPIPAQQSQSGPLIHVNPSSVFSTFDKPLDVLFVPGGVPGTFDFMQDHQSLNFIHTQAQRSRYVTSVCTGSLILGAAGLLKGKRAASHWATLEVLAEFGAIPVDERVVIDGKIVTGGGVTAGLDFGLTLAGILVGETYAQAIQLYLEYNPQPPFNAGSPKTAPKVSKAFLDEMFKDMVVMARQLARHAVKTHGVSE